MVQGTGESVELLYGRLVIVLVATLFATGLVLHKFDNF